MGIPEDPVLICAWNFTVEPPLKEIVVSEVI
jgi:hypothetical protein